MYLSKDNWDIAQGDFEWDFGPSDSSSSSFAKHLAGIQANLLQLNGIGK